MRRNLYIAAFVAVLLVACIGGFVGGRVLLSRLQGDFTARPSETAVPSPVVIATGNAGDQQATEAPAPTATAQPRATVLVVPAPVTDQPSVLTAEPTWTPGVELPTLEAGTDLLTETPLAEESGTPEASATPIPDFPYVLAHQVRYTSGDCPGTYALGTVTDARGNPLPGIRLELVDEYGNAETAQTKPGPGDTGHFDFPMGGPARRFYMTVVDANNNPLSPRVEILHELAPYQGKGCRWVDWRKTQ